MDLVIVSVISFSNSLSIGGVMVDVLALNAVDLSLSRGRVKPKTI
jgi:hypothetical protein